MERNTEKWESLRLEAQSFAPQEYCATCESTETMTLKGWDPGCQQGKIHCVGQDHEIKDIFAHTDNITFVPPTGDVTAIRQFWADAFALVSQSDDFLAHCAGGGEDLGPSKVVIRPNRNQTEVNSSNIGNWTPGFCDMAQGSEANPNAIAFLQFGWERLENHS